MRRISGEIGEAEYILVGMEEIQDDEKNTEDHKVVSVDNREKKGGSWCTGVRTRQFT